MNLECPLFEPPKGCLGPALEQWVLENFLADKIWVEGGISRNERRRERREEERREEIERVRYVK